MLTIKSKKSSFGINFPTDVTEVTKDVLDAVTKDINLPEYYCLIALCHKTKVFDFVASLNKNAGPMTSVVPLLAKINDKERKQLNANVGDRIITDRTNLERGTHIHVPTMITSTNAGNYFAKDKDLINDIIHSKYDYGKEGLLRPEIIVLEFKIIAVADIRATVPTGTIIIDPFKVNGAAN